jgi:hypothetical protein
METPEFEHSHHHRTGRPWLDVLLGVSAVSISFISLFLAIANGRAMERLVQSNSWPRTTQQWTAACKRSIFLPVTVQFSMNVG